MSPITEIIAEATRSNTKRKAMPQSTPQIATGCFFEKLYNLSIKQQEFMLIKITLPFYFFS